MSGGGGTSTVQKSDPWAGVQPELMNLYAGANLASNTPKSFYPHTTVAPLTGTTLQANQGIFNRANMGAGNMMGAGVLDQAQQQAQQTLRGDFMQNDATRGLNFLGSNSGMNNNSMDWLRAIGGGAMLNSNPYLDSMFNRASGQVGRQFRNNVMPGIASMFSGAGRFGSNQMAEGLGQAQEQYGNTLNNLATDIYGGNYANERGLQNQALGTFGQLNLADLARRGSAYGQLGDQFGRERTLMSMMAGQAPGLAQSDYADLSALENLGGKQEAEHQARINEAIARHNFGQNEYDARLNQYAQILQGTAGIGGTSTASQSGGGNPAMGAIGGGLMGASLLPALGSAGLLGSTAAASGMMGGAGINALGGLALGPAGLIGGALLGGLLSR